MEVKGKREGKVTLHTDDTTFCGIDVFPPEIYEDPIDETVVTYTGVIIPQPEFFEGFAQWKETENLSHRIEILKSILCFIKEKDGRKVLCFTLNTTKKNGWRLGKMLLDEWTEDNKDTQTKKTSKGRRYKVQDKVFGEKHAITLFTYACVIAVMFQHISREVTRAKSLESLQKPNLQFLLDNLSGDPAPDVNTIQWNLNLMLFIIENSPLKDILKNGLQKSCFHRFGISVPQSSKVKNEEEIVGHNSVPLMIAADWFVKICRGYPNKDRMSMRMQPS